MQRERLADTLTRMGGTLDFSRLSRTEEQHIDARKRERNELGRQLATLRSTYNRLLSQQGDQPTPETTEALRANIANQLEINRKLKATE